MKDFEFMVVSAVNKNTGEVRLAVTKGHEQLNELTGALNSMRLDGEMSVTALLAWAEEGTIETKNWEFCWLIQEEEGLCFEQPGFMPLKDNRHWTAERAKALIEEARVIGAGIAADDAAAVDDGAMLIERELGGYIGWEKFCILYEMLGGANLCDYMTKDVVEKYKG